MASYFPWMRSLFSSLIFDSDHFRLGDVLLLTLLHSDQSSFCSSCSLVLSSSFLFDFSVFRRVNAFMIRVRGTLWIRISIFRTLASPSFIQCALLPFFAFSAECPASRFFSWHDWDLGGVFHVPTPIHQFHAAVAALFVIHLQLKNRSLSRTRLRRGRFHFLRLFRLLHRLS